MSAEPRYYEAVIKVCPSDPPETQKRHIIEGLAWACVLLHDEYELSADEIEGILERIVEDVQDDEAMRR